jgi:dCMP deaminase
MARETIDQYYLNLAKAAATRSTCPRAQCGSIVHHPITDEVYTGYNGAPSGHPHCDSVGCILTISRNERERCVRSVHAEANALLKAGFRARGAILYCTHQPCFECMKLAINANIDKIFYIEDYQDEMRDAVLTLWQERRCIRVAR